MRSRSSAPHGASGTAQDGQPRLVPVEHLREHLPERVGGYRVGRCLGAGSASQVFLGHPDEIGTAGVALKVFSADASATQLEREVRALCAGLDGSVPGLTRLIDVTTLPDGAVCLVLERLDGESLAAYLNDCATLLLPGEAVTILAPVLATLGGLHDSGFTHPRLSLATVSLDSRGRPVVLGLGSLEELPAAGPARTDLLRADYARVALLVRGTVEKIDPTAPDARQAADLVARCEAAVTASPFQQCLPQLEQGLFDWTDAVPVHPSIHDETPAGSPPGIRRAPAGVSGTARDRRDHAGWSA